MQYQTPLLSLLMLLESKIRQLLLSHARCCFDIEINKHIAIVQMQCWIERGPPLQTKSFNIVHQQIPIYERRHKKEPPKHLNFCMVMRRWMGETKEAIGPPHYGINWPPGIHFETRCGKKSITEFYVLNLRFHRLFFFYLSFFFSHSFADRLFLKSSISHNFFSSEFCFLS